MGSDAHLDNTASLRAHRRLGFRPTERLQFFCKNLAGPVAEDFQVRWYAGSRDRLRPLFALAEDSPTRLDSYLDAGRVLVATDGDQVLGHLQLVATGRPGEAEITNMAVRQDHQSRGIGGRLLNTAIAAFTDEGGSTVWVAT
ncbi:MAG: GNAT family N-acetyltransferase, partial [Pseudonocardiales bacterium]|nr:GNAT family N-acetyltransferase [Pseudonocardiales bacterium]